MPITRKIRIGLDTIARLRKAAGARHREATDLLDGGHHLAAIYLAGYAAEMTIGAAYFGTVRGYGRDQLIGDSERKDLLTAARSLSQAEDKSHPIDGLARYLVREKEQFNPPGFEGKLAKALVEHVEELCEYWAPKLRYRPIEATPQQSRLVLKLASWILENCPKH